jgi:endopeptidase Clp ATP-binding regulatory subunit ClpX
MATDSEKIPDPKELEKEISDFLAKKFGENVKIVSPMVLPREALHGSREKPPSASVKSINFDLKPEELIAHLDQYVVKQERAKAILATKICTHFHRIRRTRKEKDLLPEMVGTVKNNVLMIGPTGVGKTYIIKLIADKIGVPFIKGDATKFSETGYVGGDVEDLVRDLVREADDDIEMAQYGIIYIDEIDKIASSRNHMGADVSRTGVQRALLKPMEDTDIDLKVPHDPISMIQEIERFRKTGQRERRTVNTKNILFIVSGAFNELVPIVQRRLSRQGIGFGARIKGREDQEDILRKVKSEDLIEFGFESEFVGRLPVRAVLDRLLEGDLYDILKNPNNPIVLGKKLDFAAYGIEVKFEDAFLQRMAHEAYQENTGARGLVSAVENALLEFEKKLPSMPARFLPVTAEIVEHPAAVLAELSATGADRKLRAAYDGLKLQEKEQIKEYLRKNSRHLAARNSLTMTEARMDIVAAYYVNHVVDVGHAIRRIKSYYDEIKRIELDFYQRQDINIVLEEDAIDHIIEQVVHGGSDLSQLTDRLNQDFEYGLKLVREKTGRSRFFITRSALTNPEAYIAGLIKGDMGALTPQGTTEP